MAPALLLVGEMGDSGTMPPILLAQASISLSGSLNLTLPRTLHFEGEMADVGAVTSISSTQLLISFLGPTASLNLKLTCGLPSRSVASGEGWLGKFGDVGVTGVSK